MCALSGNIAMIASTMANSTLGSLTVHKQGSADLHRSTPPRTSIRGPCPQVRERVKEMREDAAYLAIAARS